MTLRALIVSDRADYRQLLAHHVTLEWRDALPAEYEPATRGRLPAGFTGVAYDVVLLDHEVQDARGLEWLEDLVDPPCPTGRLLLRSRQRCGGRGEGRVGRRAGRAAADGLRARRPLR